VQLSVKKLELPAPPITHDTAVHNQTSLDIFRYIT